MTRRLAWIWPKDPRPGNQSHWPRYWRLRDVLTNKGPDIYVGAVGGGKTKTRRVNWSGWPVKHQHQRQHKDQHQHSYRHQHQHQHQQHQHQFQEEHEDDHDHDHERHYHDEYQHQEQYQPPRSASSSCSCACATSGENVQRQGTRKATPAVQIGSSRRGSTVRYDFRTRRYVVPDCGTWSRVEYCGRKGHVVPVQYWDRDGVEYPAGCWHDVVYGRCR